MVSYQFSELMAETLPSEIANNKKYGLMTENNQLFAGCKIICEYKKMYLQFFIVTDDIYNGFLRTSITC